MAVAFKDYYKTLGIPRTASPEEVKKAFRSLARQFHPDVAADKSTAEEKFKEVNEAYEVLSDPEKRKRFDDLGANWQQPVDGPPPRWQAHHFDTGGQVGDNSFELDGTGFSDFFETYFAGRGGGFRGWNPRSGSVGEDSFARKGYDVEADILVTLEEALKGSLRRVTLRRPGEGGAPDRVDTYNVKIPAGVHEGKRIRLGGQGRPGVGGAAAGDLYLRVRLAWHPNLTVRDADLYYDLDLAPWEAVLGVKLLIPALDGPTSLKIPPGTTAGTRLRLRSLGLPDGKGARGDLYVSVRIQVPTSVSDAERTLWEQLADKSTYKPRNTPS